MKLSGNGLLARMGIGEGFVVTSVNYKAVKTPEQLEETLQDVRGKVLLEGITQNGQKGYYSFYF